jgi:protein gp37
MSAQTKIEWCDATFNPWIGCTKVSPGCTNCYAEGESKRRGWAQWGKGKERHRTSANYWKQPLAWDKRAEARDQRSAARPRIFCGSLCDWLDDEVPIEWLADLLALIHATPNLDWLLLTKRPENWNARIHDAFRDDRTGGDLDYLSLWLDGDPVQNVWFGVSVEDQTRADERIPLLLQIPAKIRFLSCEPLLGRVNYLQSCFDAGNHLHPYGKSGIDWLICGGESGHGARPMHPDWTRLLRDECRADHIPFFFKQRGEWGIFKPFAGGDLGGDMRRGIVQQVRAIGEHDGHFRRGDIYMRRVGKKKAGRLLDGREYSEFPSSVLTFQRLNESRRSEIAT